MMGREDLLRKIISVLVERIANDFFLNIEEDMISKTQKELLKLGTDLNKTSNLIEEAVNKHLMLAATDLIIKKVNNYAYCKNKE